MEAPSETYASNPESEVFKFIEDCTDLSEINIAKSNEFIINDRGNNLHVRTYWPEGIKPSAIVIFMHGYASHVNRPPHKHLSQQFTTNNIAYITIDFHGHGYSEGLKGCIHADSDVIDDTLGLLFALYSKENETSFYKLQHNAESNVPFYIIGHSMGGAAAILVSNLLTQLKLNSSHTDFSIAHQEQIRELGKLFRGAVLLCPAIVVPKPPPFVVFLMQNVLVPLFSVAPMPAVLSSSNDAAIWSNDHYLRYVKHDQFPNNENGLSWGGPLRFQTANSILQISDRVSESLPHIKYPFLVMHDPQDKVCLYEGVERLMKEAATPAADKTFVQVEDGLHDLLANKLGFVSDRILEWIRTRQEIGATVTYNEPSERDDPNAANSDASKPVENDIEASCF